MCGRYLLTSPIEAVRATFSVETGANLPPRYNIAPTQPVPIVRLGETGLREFVPVQWGLIPSWLKALPKDRPVINARSETVRDKPFFRAAYKRRRCLVPANGFYEWQKVNGGKRPMAIELEGEQLFAFAGLWEVWEGAGEGSYLESMAIMTAPASPAIAAIHHRMPVIVQPEDFDLWLGEDGIDDPLDSMADIDGSRFHAFEVSKRVNNVRNDDDQCVKPVEISEPGGLFV